MPDPIFPFVKETVLFKIKGRLVGIRLIDRGTG